MLTFALIPLFPLIGFLINGLGFNRIPKKAVGLIGTGASLLSFLMVLISFFTFKEGLDNPIIAQYFNWFQIGGIHFNFLLQIDQLSLLMMFIITGVGTLIHAYSIGYMEHDPGFGKFFAYLNLFLFNMLLLVMGGSFLIMFIGWEGVGLCSYLLIGFWNQNEEYGNAARKAFIMNRVGDLGFLVAIFLIIQKFGSVEFFDIFNQASQFSINDPIIQAICFSLFVGATGKSAQIPLFTWLPDAMAGPTPVSALIHAATMVTAGIYLVVRANILFTMAPQVLNVIAWIGLLTALYGAIVGVYQNDIKKVLAYSTVSQLGYMFLGLGVMAYTAGFFHVITHAFFKALLFLGAGSVIHALGGEQDIRKMGGLWNKTKGTAITFLIGTLAISGIPPFAGFFSKDEILANVFAHNKFMWVLAAFGSFLTAFYMFRLFFLTFFNKFRGTPEQEKHIHESPNSMVIPLYILAILSTVGGFIGFPEIFNLPNYLGNFLSPIFKDAKNINPNLGHLSLSHSTEWTLLTISVLIALIGASLAYAKYYLKNSIPQIDSEIAGLKKIAYNKFYVDEFYNKLIIVPISTLGKVLNDFVEPNIFDSILTKIAQAIDLLSIKLKRFQNGGLPFYLLIMTAFIAIILLASLGPEIMESFKNLNPTNH